MVRCFDFTQTPKGQQFEMELSCEIKQSFSNLIGRPQVAGLKELASILPCRVSNPGDALQLDSLVEISPVLVA